MLLVILRNRLGSRFRNLENRRGGPIGGGKNMLLRLFGAVLAALLLPSLALAQAWPSKPIKYIVPFAPGGTTDILGRMVATGLQAALGQPVVVENKPGQAGSLGAAELARAAPDGYTIGGGTISSHAINATLYSKLIPTRSGGTHEAGFRTGIFEALGAFMDGRGLAPKGVKLIPDD